MSKSEFLENTLEEIIFNNPDRLPEAGLHAPGKLYRQVHLGSYGIADIIAIDIYPREICISILELKKGKVGFNELAQACRYKTCIDEYLYSLEVPRKLLIHVNAIAIGSSIDETSDFVYLYNKIDDYISIYTYEYGFDGLKFNLVGKRWHNTGFHPKCLRELHSTIKEKLLQSIKESVYSKGVENV
ncbi:MAG TPA: hypothetical protein VD907_06810 [Verrucomicrobiae bacterium]|nr:hypothetical protein [Verrucomicrobiae bacterium]